jgi:N-succinyldiaminopimelate aminotransferase
MNPHLDALLPYPFERLAALKAGVVSTGPTPHIALSIGEPKHAPPPFLVDALADRTRLVEGLGGYPATRGSDALRAAIAAWLERRFVLANVRVDPARHVLPVAGTREALFSFAQAVLSGRPGSVCAMPNPFYQIYEGAALLRGATPWYVACPGPEFQPDFDAVPDDVWRACELLYICSPGNPCGAILPLETLDRLIELADRHDFVIAADECYSEIYRDESSPPPGLLQACARMGRNDFRRCIVFHSLSKRSNLPGLRSGFVAGDATLLERYYLYRTYHGCALPGHVQEASRLAWSDEAHVVANRALYRAKFAAVTQTLEGLGCRHPDGGFYYWPATPVDDETFARELFRRENVTVLPGSYLARDAAGTHPGRNRVRMALVASLEECVEAACRIARFVATL